MVYSPLCSQNFWDTLQIHQNPDQNKVLSDYEGMNDELHAVTLVVLFQIQPQILIC